MVQEQKIRTAIAEFLWGKVDFYNLPKVDNQKVEKLLKGGYLFGFTASDLLIILSAILTLIFLQIQPYLIPYLEGRLDLSTFKVIENKIIEEQVFERPLDAVSTIDKSSSPSSTTQMSSASASANNKQQTSSPSSSIIDIPSPYKGINWEKVEEARLETHDSQGPREIFGRVHKSKPYKASDFDSTKIFFEYYKPWLQKEGWQGYSDFGGTGDGFEIGYKKDGKYFIISEERSSQEYWILVIRYN